MSRPSFDFKKMKESIFKKMKRKSRKELATMPGVYHELPPPRPMDDTYLRPARGGPSDDGRDVDGAKANADESEVESSGIPTLPPPPPKPLTESDGDVEIDIPISRTSVSLAGVIMKDSTKARTSTWLDEHEPSSSKQPRNSHHIIHENEFGDKVEYAISKKDTSPERHKIIPNKDKTANSTEEIIVANDADEVYLEPSQQHLTTHISSEDSKEIARYARHIDVVPDVDPYYTDTSSVGKTATQLIKKFETSSQPHTFHSALHSQSAPGRVLGSNHSLVTGKQHEKSNDAVTGSEYNLRPKWIKTEKQIHEPDENVTKNPVLPPVKDEETSGIAKTRVPAQLDVTTEQAVQYHENTNHKTPVSPPPVSPPPVSPPPTALSNITPGSHSVKDWHNNQVWHDRVVQQTSNGQEPSGMHEHTEQHPNVSNAVISQNLPSPDPVNYHHYVHGEHGHNSAPLQTSNENLRSVYFKSNNNELKDHPKPIVKKSVSYEDHSGAVTSSRHATATQTVADNLFSNDESPQPLVYRRDNVQMKSTGTSVEENIMNPVTHTKMKTRGTSAGREPEMDDVVHRGHNNSHQLKYEDDADFDDGVSRVHYVPKNEHKRHQRIRIETYREAFTQTEEAMFNAAEPRRNVYSRSKTYNHAVRQRSQLPESWQSPVSRTYGYDDDSEISKRVSKEWYKKDDAPNLWDPDKMLNMFAEELHRKAAIGQTSKAVTELREEFDPKKFLDYVPKQDSSGAPFPPWKRLVMAKQMAEKAQLDEDQRNKKTEDEIRLENMPLWKRVIVQRREADRAANP